MCRNADGCWPCGKVAQDYAAKLLKAGSSTIHLTGKQSYGRPIGTVEVDGQDLGESMIAAGLAVPATSYLKDDPARAQRYVAAYERAVARRAGVHAGYFIDPAKWRRGERLSCEGQSPRRRRRLRPEEERGREGHRSRRCPMPVFASTPAPVHTLWDTPDMATQRLPGVWWVKTPSHGGFVLSDERQAAMPEALRLDSIYYEEDVEWTLVVLAFEAEFEQAKDPYFDIERGIAHQTARHWRPDRYGRFTGQIITPSDSYVLTKIAVIETAIGEIGVRSASGDWADWVPKGKVGVVGRRIIGCDHLGFTQYDGPDVTGLCDAARYDSRRPVNTFAALGVELVSS